MNQSWRAKFEKLNLDPERCTCLKCADDQTCPYAFDAYNYEGDCLGESKKSTGNTSIVKLIHSFFL